MSSLDDHMTYELDIVTNGRRKYIGHDVVAYMYYTSTNFKTDEGTKHQGWLM